jgi:type IV pilus assembly protein PilC
LHFQVLLRISRAVLTFLVRWKNIQMYFSQFYISMVRAGEESGKLTDSFRYLADYLERQYELTSKTKNALIYPAFVIATFIIVMVLMLT